MDIFCKLWSPGIKFSRTYKYPEGRLIICALIAIVCDLLGARKVSGFAAISHEYFCSLCLCRRSTKGLDNTDYRSWQHRTNDDCRKWAGKYLAAETPDARQAIFDACGIRWSQLLRLPYFDITRCVVVDSMHNLFLGLLKRHFQEVLGVGAEKAKTVQPIVCDVSVLDPPADSDLTAKDKKDVRKLVTLLQAPLSMGLSGTHEQNMKKMMGFRLPALEHVACNHSIAKPNGACPMTGGGRTKKPYASSLLNWRLSQEETDDDTPLDVGHILTPKEMGEIRKDIQEMITPSWLTSVPKNLGNAAHGKLKADQWRVLGTVYLPISLIRMWGKTDSLDSQTLLRREILLVTISLLSAVVIATSRKATEANANRYAELMHAYLTGIRTLFPKYKFRPNHHMAMHLQQFIVDFGPPHGWWTFPFERLIGLLQRLLHNGKIGELEGTITRSFNKAANLRGLLEKPQCPEIIRKCKALLHKFADPHVRSTLLTDASTLTSLFEDATSPASPGTSASNPDDWDNERAVPTPADLGRILAGVHNLNLPRQVVLQQATIIRGIRYTIPSLHLGNSLVVLQQATIIRGIRYTIPSLHLGNSLVLVKDANDRQYAAQIHRIFSFLDGGAVQKHLVLRPYTPVDEKGDVFAQYPVLGAKTWKTKVGPFKVVKVEDVVSHFACLHLSDDEMVAIDLSREYVT
ncbi:hypothetical protein CVT24_006317 [Panaeolus cyanescens]|uniref:DUF4218 domain-containing protein n=1 Tax=Panaeolus cyanescens TaxID=181874 RepID=A0A409YEA7_9AGAR|nr:hypothetical protein CVT24_006317 [Panaeolus cyanescens]